MNTPHASLGSMTRLFPRSLHAISMPDEKPDGLDWLSTEDIHNFLNKQRPSHRWDPLLVNGLNMQPVNSEITPTPVRKRHEYNQYHGLEGYVSIPHTAMEFDQAPVAAKQPEPEPEPAGWGKQEIIDLFLKKKHVLAEEVVPYKPTEVLEVEDDRVHQLFETNDPVQQATILLRLLEEDVYTFERLGQTDLASVASEALGLDTKGVKTPLELSGREVQRRMAEERLTYVEVVWGNALNALVYISHRRLATTLLAIREAERIADLQASLTRMGYVHWVDQDTGRIHLRHKDHGKYGVIIF